MKPKKGKTNFAYGGTGIIYIDQTGTAGLSEMSAFLILSTAAWRVLSDAAYEIRMQLSSPNASPGTSATCKYTAITQLGE